MIAVVVRQKLASERLAAYLDVMLDHARRSMAEEPGCLRFDVAQVQGDPTAVFLYELYRDQAAVDAHVQTERFARVVATIGPWFSEPEQVTLCRTAQVAEDVRA